MRSWSTSRPALSRLLGAAAPSLVLLATACVASPQEPAAASNEDELFVDSTQLWTGDIPVCFLDPGLEKEKAWLRSAIELSWQSAAGVKFVGWDQCGPESPGISIHMQENSPSWSAIGTSSKGRRPSMSLGLMAVQPDLPELYRELGLKTIGMHEFGHALGFRHEHERSDTPESCASRSPVPGGETFGPWDGYSMMNYCIKGSGLQISDQDAAGARKFYGPPKVPVPPTPFKRTVIFIQGVTQPGQDMFIRGGIDHSASRQLRGVSCEDGAGRPNLKCAVPISHLQHKNAATAGWKNQDLLLDWYGVEYWQSGGSGTPLDWTTNDWPSSWGPARTVASDGYGLTPLNVYGMHYWMLDVLMDCSKAFVAKDGTPWFEVKSFISNGPGWEGDVRQADAPYSSNNHFGKCGQLNVFRRGDSSVRYSPL